jgi:protease-4
MYWRFQKAVNDKVWAGRYDNLMKKIGSFFYSPKKTSDDKPKRWNIFRIIGTALKRTCTAIGAMVLISAVISFILISRMAGNVAPPLPAEMLLVMTLDGGVSEIQSRPSILEPFPFDQPTIHNVINTLDRAAGDARVKGLILNMRGAPLSVAHIQELRTAIARFKQSGKPAKIYAASYDDPMGGLSQYYLASAFDEIWMQPVGMLSISGASMEMPYAKEALAKLGVQTQFLQREGYKGAMENFSNAEMSPESQEMWGSILTNISAKMMVDIAQDRALPIDALKTYIDTGILTGNEALQATLIDRLDYADVMVSDLRENLKGDREDKTLKLIPFERYAGSVKQSQPAVRAVNARQNTALIYVVGAIMDTAEAGGNAGADKIVEAIYQATDDTTIKAIVLRVDSPGGSPTASETIRRALVNAKAKGKKIIVSMGPVAASGGYWVATDADKIVASHGTITGSIGVVMGKFEASGLWDKVGVNWQGPQLGQNADMWSPNKPFDAQAQARMNILIDDIYDAFLTRVAEGRGMTKDEARNVAQGRAWTGAQAQERGLVDTLGGFDVALDETAKMLGLNSRDDLNIIRIPREKNAVEQFIELFGAQVSLGHMFGLNSELVQRFKAYVTQARLSDNATNSSVYNAELEAFR